MNCNCIEKLALNFAWEVGAVKISLSSLHLQISHVLPKQIEKQKEMDETRRNFKGCRWSHSIEGAVHFKYCPFCGGKLDEDLNCFSIARTINEKLKEMKS